MILIKNQSRNNLSSERTARRYYILLSITLFSIISSLHYSLSSNSSFLIISKLINLQNKIIGVQTILSVDPLIINLTFSFGKIYHHDGIAYDYYSKNDLGQSKASYQWKIWPLPNEINQTSSIDNIETSPFVMSKLPFIDKIYMITDPRLIERHKNVKKAFDRQGISIESIEWRMKWNYTTCNSNLSHSYVYQRLNLKDKPLDKENKRKCALLMKHVDIWYEMAERKMGLALIVEDDTIFVPFFKEKFTRMIFFAINNGILRMNGRCVKSNKKSISKDERINQNAMIVIGTCPNMYSPYFRSYLSDAPPILTTHKSSSSRCTNAYLLTSCSSQALVDQIHAQKNDFVPSDHMQNHLFRLSRTLQSFWMDPPLAYQGNQVIDLDKLSSFKIQSCMYL